MLETVVDVQHEIESLCIELLGVLLEVVCAAADGAVCTNAVVAAALLISACCYTGVVGYVAQLQVYAQWPLGNTELLADTCVEHEASVATCLLDIVATVAAIAVDIGVTVVVLLPQLVNALKACNRSCAQVDARPYSSVSTAWCPCWRACSLRRSRQHTWCRNMCPGLQCQSCL